MAEAAAIGAGARWRTLTGLDARALLFSFNSFAAAMLALWIGFRFGLPRPYWAMLTVYITAQPLSGALRSKAVYRVLGTSLGATAAVMLVPSLVNAPELLSLAFALWTGLCLFLSLLDRTPRAYVFMLAGYTAPIIGFPSVNAPGEVFQTAVARVEEITVGILCATVVHSIVFPRSVAPVLAERIAGYIKDAERWIQDALRGRPGPQTDDERRRLAADLTDLHLLATHLPFDTANLRPTQRAVRVLQDRIAVLLPLATAVEDRLSALRPEAEIRRDMEAVLAEASAWLRAEDAPRETASRLAGRVREAAPQITGESNWDDLLAASALERLAELIEAVQDCRDLHLFVAAPAVRPTPHLRAFSASRPALHRDYGMAGLSAAASIFAVCTVCALWIATAWPDGATAAMMAGVFCSFFATQDDPAPALIGFLTFTILSLPIAGLYLVAILPAIDGFPLLVAVLAPVMLVLGYLQGRPSTYGKAMPMILGVVGSLSLQETFAPNVTAFINGSLAQIVGIAAAVVITRLFRSVGAEWSARRLLRAGWRELARISVPGASTDRAALTSRMLDRLGLLAPRLALAQSRPDLLGADVLNDLRIALNIVDIQAARRAAPPHTAAPITELLRRLSRRFSRLAGGREPDEPGLLATVDRSLAALTAAEPGPERTAGVLSLAGLRRNLCPGSPDYRPGGSAGGEDG